MARLTALLITDDTGTVNHSNVFISLKPLWRDEKQVHLADAAETEQKRYDVLSDISNDANDNIEETTTTQDNNRDISIKTEQRTETFFKT